MGYRYAVRGSVSGWQVGESEEDAHELLNEGEDVLEEIAFPTHKEVCGRCRGEGKHDHPAFSNGITSSEWAEWDYEERENYIAGVYDVTCEECGGANVVDEIDTDRLPEAVREALFKRWDEDAATRRMMEAERRMGA